MVLVPREKSTGPMTGSTKSAGLRVGHRPRLEPTVEDFVNSRQIATPFLGGDRHGINRVPMNVLDAALGQPAPLLKLGQRSDDHRLVSRGKALGRGWRRPSGVYRQRPVVTSGEDGAMLPPAHRRRPTLGSGCPRSGCAKRPSRVRWQPSCGSASP